MKSKLDSIEHESSRSLCNASGRWRNLLRLKIGHTSPIIDIICAAICAAAFINWRWIGGGPWDLVHAEMFHDLAALARDVDIVNAATGLVVYLTIRVALTPIPSALLATVAGVGLAVASKIKMQALNVPILPWDLWSLHNLSQFPEFLDISKTKLVAALAMGTASVVVGMLRFRRALIREHNHVEAAFFAASCLWLWNAWALAPNTPRFLSGQIQNLTWSPGASYTNFGPFYTVFSNLKYVSLEQVTAGGLAAAKLLDTKSFDSNAEASGDRPDVVVVLSEAFTDLPVRIFGRQFRCLSPDLYSRLITPAWGGFTANVEAEILTGYPQAIYPAGAVPYEMYFKRPIPHALPNVFTAHGYQSAAVHTYIRSFYSRPEAYRMLGFEAFSGIEDLKAPILRGQFVDDRVLFNEVLARLNGGGKGPKFLQAVTMMAHLPYDSPRRYPIRADIAERLPAPLEAHRLALTQYGSMIYDHEEMLCAFFDALKKRKRRTVVVFYGDHYPSFGSIQIYRDIHAAIAPGTNFNLLSQYSTTPLVAFDNKQGFLALPSSVPAYNLGTLILQVAGINPTGVWSMPHKLTNRPITAGGWMSDARADQTTAPHRIDTIDPELGVLRAHANLTLFERK